MGQGAYQAAGLGQLWLVWNEKGLLRLVLPGGDRPYGQGEGPPVADIPAHVAEILDRYFAGEDVDPVTIPVDLYGTDFQVKVWNALREVERGKVRSYAGIATDVGSPRAMRAVGVANANNPIPIVVPCHRVVETGNKLGGYSGGLQTKRFLLELEGVDVEGEEVRPGQLGLPIE